MTAENDSQDRWSIQKPNPDQFIWRYMDFTQFISILQNKSMWFNRVDQFEDPFEGKVPDNNYSTIQDRYADTEIPQNKVKEITDFLQLSKSITFANCWHENDYQSAAMWDLYLSNDQGIAVRSTPEQVKSAFDESQHSIISGKVHYVDYDDILLPENNLLSPAFFKRRSFEHENEIRFVFARWDVITEDGQTPLSDLPSGEYVSVDVDSLIDAVYVSPTSPDWFSDLVTDIVDEYNVDASIEHSDLYDEGMK
ncbi:hypothetical protein [Natrinema salsiterrestre]|uniref:DUF2971 domain-containing protein n=1 Tax=Natrinema salsiterrestre TaxID=2950540 RepID=A0A9Q4L539_9EURY|nr:hypothetical protein [Natrinema salsiterrestre]MDF9747028.1 hypothetical protein [Natrinema salsiterrestre]